MNFGRAGLGFDAVGTALRGGDGMAVLEREKRKAAIGGLLDQMGISGPKRAILEMMPQEAATSALWGQVNPSQTEGKVVGDKLIDPFTGKVIGDYGTPSLSTGDFLDAMGVSESGNNFGADNGEGYVGRVQMGQARLTDYARATGSGPISLEDYKNNPELQKKVEAWHFPDLAASVDKYAHLYGTEINGIPFTREAAMAIAHLGGLGGKNVRGGLYDYVRTNGQINPADSNGTRLSDYQAKFAGTKFGDDAEKYRRILLDPRLTPQQRDYVQGKIDALAPKEPADEYQRYVQEEKAAGNSPLSRIDYAKAKREGDGTVVYDPVTGNPIVSTGTAKPVKLTEGQSKDLVYYERATGSSPLIDQYEDAVTSYVQKGASEIPVVGNSLTSKEYQMGTQAGSEWLASILRKDTGAAVTPQESEMYGRMYLPQPGDKPETLRQKSEARKRAESAIKRGLGTAEIIAEEMLAQRGRQEGSQQGAAGQLLQEAPDDDALIRKWLGTAQ